MKQAEEAAPRLDKALAHTAEFRADVARAEEALAPVEAEPGAGPDDDSTDEEVIGRKRTEPPTPGPTPVEVRASVT